METTVVCGYDASPESRRALHWAAKEAALRQEPLRVVMALPWADGAQVAAEPVGYLPTERKSVELATAAIEKAVRELTAGHHISVTSSVELGAAIPTLLHEARRASLLVLGARGIGGFERMLLGSVSTAVAERAGCPVVVVRPPAPRSEAARHAGRVVVGVDGSPASEHAIGFAFEAAARRHSGLVAVHASHPDPILQALAIVSVAKDGVDVLSSGASGLIDEAVSPWRDRYPDVPVTPFSMLGHPVTVLGYAAAGSPMLVVGTRGRGDLKAAALGSVSRGVLHHATGPVAVVPASTARLS